MGQSARVDEEAMEACLKEVTKALLEVRPAATWLCTPLPLAAASGLGLGPGPQA